LSRILSYINVVVFFSKFRKCICISLKPYKLGLGKVVKLKAILLYFICGRSNLQGFTFITQKCLKVIKGQDPLEGEGVEVGTSRYFPRTYFGKFYQIILLTYE
jgi:hypothetical protein